MDILGRARVRTPEMAQMPPTSLPQYETGYVSPYPTVVMVMMAHHIATAKSR